MSQQVLLHLRMLFLRYFVLTHMFHLCCTSSGTKIAPQRPLKQLQQHLEAYSRDSRIISPLTQLIPNESMLSMRNLIQTKHNPSILQSLPNRISPGPRNMRILLPKDHNQLPTNILNPQQRIIIHALTQRPRMDIRRKVAHSRAHTLIERAAKRQMAAETHASGTDGAVARRQRQQVVDGERGVLVVGGQGLRDLPRVAAVGVGRVVGQRRRPRELVVRRRRRRDEAVPADLPREAGDGARHCAG